MIAAFASGLLVGTLTGMSSWLVAAAYLETRRMRGLEARGELAMEAVASAAVPVRTSHQDVPLKQPERLIPGMNPPLFVSRRRNLRPTSANTSVKRVRPYPEL